MGELIRLLNVYWAWGYRFEGKTAICYNAIGWWLIMW